MTTYRGVFKLLSVSIGAGGFLGGSPDENGDGRGLDKFTIGREAVDEAGVGASAASFKEMKNCSE